MITRSRRVFRIREPPLEALVIGRVAAGTLAETLLRAAELPKVYDTRGRRQTKRKRRPASPTDDENISTFPPQAKYSPPDCLDALAREETGGAAGGTRRQYRRPDPPFRVGGLEVDAEDEEAPDFGGTETVEAGALPLPRPRPRDDPWEVNR